MKAVPVVGKGPLSVPQCFGPMLLFRKDLHAAGRLHSLAVWAEPAPSRVYVVTPGQ